uniref:DNA-binding protein inhibitor ID-2 n=1 Tax=Oryctolagus cuniculus TaxID=9986 RepID=G1TUW8_RABIT
MKAFSPVRSVRKSGVSEHGLGVSRSKTPADDPMSLLYNMNDCYSKLKELVPSIPQDRKVSKMEILHRPAPRARAGGVRACGLPGLTRGLLRLPPQASEFLPSDSKALCG